MPSCCFGYMGPLGFQDVPSIRQEDESEYVHRLADLFDRAEEIKGFMALDGRCHNWTYDRYYLLRNADLWSRELDFELWHTHGPACRLSG